MQWLDHLVTIKKEPRYNARDMSPSPTSRAVVEFFESCELEAYVDGGGVYTIGFGHTEGVYPGMTITKEAAIAFLKSDMEEHCNYVRDLVTTPIPQTTFDALSSWTFNLGGNALRTSTLLRKLNAGDLDAVPYEMLRWAHDNGEWVRGLAKRRHAEALMCLGADWKDHGEFKSYNKRRWKKLLESDFNIHAIR